MPCDVPGERIRRLNLHHQDLFLPEMRSEYYLLAPRTNAHAWELKVCRGAQIQIYDVTNPSTWGSSYLQADTATQHQISPNRGSPSFQIQ